MSKPGDTKRGQATVAQRRELAARAETVRELIEALGGPAKVAGKLSITHPSVCEWMREDRIPFRKIQKIADEFNIRRRPLKQFSSELTRQ